MEICYNDTVFYSFKLEHGTNYIQTRIYDLLRLVVLTLISGKDSNELIFNQDYSHFILHSVPVQPNVIRASF